MELSKEEAVKDLIKLIKNEGTKCIKPVSYNLNIKSNKQIKSIKER